MLYSRKNIKSNTRSFLFIQLCKYCFLLLFSFSFLGQHIIAFAPFNSNIKSNELSFYASNNFPVSSHYPLNIFCDFEINEFESAGENEVEENAERGLSDNYFQPSFDSFFNYHTLISKVANICIVSQFNPSVSLVLLYHSWKIFFI